MNAARAEIFLEGLRQEQIDRLLKAGVPWTAIIHPVALTVTRGSRAMDGRLDYDPHLLPHWLAFEEADDFVFWPFDRLANDNGHATAEGRAFAIGEAAIDNAGTYAFDGWLRVWPNPLAWLKANRDGIVVVDWSRAFDWLRDCPRILGETPAVAERLDALMHPPRLPAIAARTRNRKRAR